MICLSKNSCKGSVLCQSDGTRISGVPVIPLDKIATIIWYSSNFHLRQISITSSSGDLALHRIAAHHRQLIAVRCKRSRERSVTQQCHHTRVGSVTIVPLRKMIAIVWCGGYLHLRQISVTSITGNLSFQRVDAYHRQTIKWLKHRISLVIACGIRHPMQQHACRIISVHISIERG